MHNYWYYMFLFSLFGESIRYSIYITTYYYDINIINAVLAIYIDSIWVFTNLLIYVFLILYDLIGMLLKYYNITNKIL
jgi:hypothetical protein